MHTNDDEQPMRSAVQKAASYRKEIRARENPTCRAAGQ